MAEQKNQKSQKSQQPDRASRLRDNKRRHRARRKEYVADLERRLAEVREQGVQATKEVQIAAQRVVKENLKLRNLLKRSGISDDAVDAWLKQDDFMDCAQPCQPSPGPAVQEPDLIQGSACILTSKKCTRSGACRSRSEKSNISRGDIQASKDVNSGVREVSWEPNSSPAVLCSAESPLKSLSNTLYSRNLSLPPHTGSAEAPCKLLTHLAENPGADVTQLPLPIPSIGQDCRSNRNPGEDADGVECATAYRMLMQYATSEEKVDQIAQALEEGCTPIEGGGCKVKKSAVWKVLDDVCG